MIIKQNHPLHTEWLMGAVTHGAILVQPFTKSLFLSKSSWDKMAHGANVIWLSHTVRYCQAFKYHKYLVSQLFKLLLYMH